MVTISKLMFMSRKRILFYLLNAALTGRTLLNIQLKYFLNTITTPIHCKMRPKETDKITGKRKPPSLSESAPTSSTKKVKSAIHSTDPICTPDPKSQIAEDNGIVLRAFYGPEMSNERVFAYKEDKLPRPIELLNSALAEIRSTREEIKVKDAIVHWFRNDLRTRDNRALRFASERAREKGALLITMYIVSPQDFEAHFTSPARVDFILRTLQELKDDLAKLNIPLYVETIEKRKRIPGRIIDLLEAWGANHLFANMEFEVDELRRDESLVRACLEKGIAMDVLPDNCVVHPGRLATGTRSQYSVYTPWFRSWIAHIHENPELLELSEEPLKNPASKRERYVKIFDSTIPTAPKNKMLKDEEKRRFQSIWPAGECEAHERLKIFVQQRIGDYKEHRNFPGENATSSLSVHFATGTLSARTAVRTARDHNRTKRLDGGNVGIETWIREIAWRDFYRHVLAHWPYIWYVCTPF